MLHSLLFSYYWLDGRSTFDENFLKGTKNIEKDSSIEIDISIKETVINRFTGHDILKIIQKKLFKNNNIEAVEDVIDKYKKLSFLEFQYMFYFNFSEICGLNPADFKDENVKMFCVNSVLKSKEFKESLHRNYFHDINLHYRNAIKTKGA